jgi:hypothetical protein
MNFQLPWRNMQVLVPIKVSADKLSKPGQYQFPFAFKLPTYLPPSFKMRQGSAQYGLPNWIWCHCSFSTLNDGMFPVLFDGPRFLLRCAEPFCWRPAGLCTVQPP